MSQKFQITSKDQNSRARTGIIYTPHGEIETPSYVIVGTHAEVRTLKPKDIEKTKTQVIISNTYHLWQKLGNNGLKNYKGVHTDLGWQGPVMTDSGGFQVFSLGFGREHGVGKIANIFPGHENASGYAFSEPKASREKNLVRITKKGVWFETEKGKQFLGPKESVSIQHKLGADIILAFDECTSPLHDYEYTKKSLTRTHAWAKICIQTHNKLSTVNYQLLYGIVQGGEWRDLREESARFIGGLPFDGFAIGGSLGKFRSDMLNVLDWTVPLLRESKPRHLLGIGKIEDIFDGVEHGIDTFDCVIPTREARHGAIWSYTGRFDILKSKHATDMSPLDENCTCPTCAEFKIRKKDLYELFKSKDPEAGRLATTHNIYFFNNLMEQIREAINNNDFLKLKKEMKANTISNQ